MKRIYVAGAIQGKTLAESLENIRKGIQLSVKVLKAGYSPFCPFIDFQFSLQEPIELQQYYDYSIAWLEVSDGVLLVPGWENSKGVKNEMDMAYKLNIPIFESIEEINWYFGKKE